MRLEFFLPDRCCTLDPDMRYISCAGARVQVAPSPLSKLSEDDVLKISQPKQNKTSVELQLNVKRNFYNEVRSPLMFSLATTLTPTMVVGK